MKIPQILLVFSGNCRGGDFFNNRVIYEILLTPESPADLIDKGMPLCFYLTRFSPFLKS